MAFDSRFQSLAANFLHEPGVTKSKMFGSEGLRVGGKFFATLVKGRLVVKLPKERVAALVASKDGEFFDPGMGRLMKEWLAVDPGSKADWLSLVGEAKAFVSSGL